MSHTDKTRLVIVGGGAAGVLLAMKLVSEKSLSITLIDGKTFYEYTPALCSVLYEPTDEMFRQHFDAVTVPYENLLPPLGIEFKLGIVRDIQHDEVLLQDQSSIPYDYAVICTGSSYQEPWKIKSNGHEIVQLEDRLRYLTEQRQRYQDAERILCIGGGPVGVELVAEIANRSPEKQVSLVSATDQVLSGSPGKMSYYAQKILHHYEQIQLITGEMAEPVDNGNSSRQCYMTKKSGTRIEADLVYMATGIQPNTAFLKESHGDWLNDKGHIQVDSYLRVNHTANLFAIGDANALDEPKMFYTAHMQAIHCAHNLQRLLQKQPLREYKGSRKAMITSMGPDYGLAYVSAGVLLRGWPFTTNKGSKLAALEKHAIERITMNDWHLKKPVNDMLYYAHEKGHFMSRVLMLISMGKIQ
ncbi:uncharacterized protein BYT42DRAFT_617997 [Radiomyces spectabilis]|uniref:uncharacterized protein n=1 Tax=Radiomyces spectabilis TaxID=64574 RepID=UPI00221FE02C|nr:uncharacterized protein BYT42DRAFT_617997 [Radiomyces spectabilis]KAI8367577.1 hypothetical protein BYT42DRAFT_617997 [Radiomyces spectabilis]